MNGSGFGSVREPLTLYEGFTIPKYSKCIFINYTNSNDGALIAIKGDKTYTAFRNNSIWQDGKILITNTDLFAKGLGSSNLNEIKSPGIYVQNYSANATTEGGYPVEDAGFLEVMAIENKGFVLQKYNAHSSSAVYKRTYTNSGWNGWKQI